MSFTRILLSSVIAATASIASAAPSFSDGDARRAMEAVWDTYSVILPLGPVNVVREGTGGGPGRLPESQFNRVVNWEKVGLVKIQYDQSFEAHRQNRGYSSEHFFAQSQLGVVRKVVITATEEGKRYVGKLGSEQGVVLPASPCKVQRMVDNQRKEKGSNELRLVKGTYQCGKTELAKRYEQIVGEPVARSEQMKFVALFRWDPFQSKWILQAEDYASMNEDFKTSNTDAALK